MDSLAEFLLVGDLRCGSALVLRQYAVLLNEPCYKKVNIQVGVHGGINAGEVASFDRCRRLRVADS